MTLDWALRTACLLAVACTVAPLLRRASAATRHLYWRLAMIATLSLPLLGAILPSWPAVPRSGLVSIDEWIVRTAHDAPTASEGARVTDEVVGSAAPMELLPTVWAFGVFAVALSSALGGVHLYRLRRRSGPAPLEWSASAVRIAARLGVPPPEVAISPDIPGPLVWGLGRAIVLIPLDAADWTSARRDAVLVHELAHIARRDVPAQVIAQVVCALHWFNPLAWRAARAMRRERELACDDAVLRAGVAPTDYAAELLAIATATFDRRQPASALSMARASEFEGRLIAVLGSRPRRMTSRARWTTPVLVALQTIAIAGATFEHRESNATGVSPWTTAIRNPPLVPGVLDSRESEPIEAHAATESSDARSRERAVLSLALRSGDDPVPALLSALEDEDGRVREKAAVGLIWRRDPRVVPALIAAASDSDPRVREKAIVALGLSGDARAKPIVAAARQDADAGVRDKAEKLGWLP